MKLFAFCLVAFILVGKCVSDDKKYEDLTPVSLGLTIEYSEDGVIIDKGCAEPEAADHAPGCPQLSWDNHDFLTVFFNKPQQAVNPTEVYVMRCFSGESIKQRAWRKHKDDISKDKQCKKIASVDTVGDVQRLSYKYVIPSDTAEATYYIRLLVRCGEGDQQEYCQDDNSQKIDGYYSVKPMDSIPAGLIVAVVVAIIIAPTFLVLYFAYEFLVLKK